MIYEYFPSQILVQFTRWVENYFLECNYRACRMNGEWRWMGIKFHPFIWMGMNGDEWILFIPIISFIPVCNYGTKAVSPYYWVCNSFYNQSELGYSHIFCFILVYTFWRIPTNVDEWGWMWMNGDECGWMGKNGDEKIGRGYYSSPFVPIRMNGWNLILLGHGILQLGHEKIPQPSFGRSKRNIFQREVGTRTLPWPRSA